MSTLESSVTLDDVFVVVGAKRVPLAPELAGYLALEIAEGAAQTPGDVDPTRVYIGEEGSVALVRPRREGREQEGDAEVSVRAILAKLLDASGSQTPALGAVARRKAAPGGLPGLVEELEAALIPVNRAAGRRALARLAREVKRVTLGVGRNASLAPGEPPARRGSSPAYSAVREPSPRAHEPAAPAPRVHEPTPPPPRVHEPTPAPPPRSPEEPPAAPREEPSLPRMLAEEPKTARRETPLAVLASSVPSAPDASELPTMEVRKDQLTAAHANRSKPPPAVVIAPLAPPEVPTVAKADEVDHLLASFGVTTHTDQAARNELKALVGLEPTPPPPGALRPDDESDDPPYAEPHESDVESLLNLSATAPPVGRVAPRLSPPPHPLASPPTAISPKLANEPYAGDVATVASAQLPPPVPREPRASRSSYSDARAAPTAPSARKVASLSSFRPPSAPKTDRTLSVLALVVLGAGAVAIYLLKPAFFSGRTDSPPPSAAPVPSAPAAPRCHEAIVVNDVPPNAEVLLRVGQAPVDVEHMPVGARIEFVATAEGFAPKRVVIASDATWDPGTDGKPPRYEAAVQLDRSRARAGAVDSWPSAEPGSEAGGKGSPGTVHLVATPRGAEMWLVAGLGPSAQIDQLKCGGDVELLIAGPTTYRKRLHIAEKSFVPLDGGTDRQAIVSAK